MPAIFSQECPTCGRTLHVQSAHENRRVVCEHCQGAFVASAQKQASAARQDWRTAIMRRADELLALVAKQSELAPAS